MIKLVIDDIEGSMMLIVSWRLQEAGLLFAVCLGRASCCGDLSAETAPQNPLARHCHHPQLENAAACDWVCGRPPASQAATGESAREMAAIVVRSVKFHSSKCMLHGRVAQRDWENFAARSSRPLRFGKRLSLPGRDFGGL